jgi:hypothetical protein
VIGDCEIIFRPFATDWILWRRGHPVILQMSCERKNAEYAVLIA